MGLIDLPAPLLQWLDTWLAVALPPLLRIIVWGALSGLLSMGLYSLISPQARIANGKREAAHARKALDACDGDWSEAAPLMRNVLSLSLKQVRLTALPAVLASLPVLVVLAWMSTAYGATFPPEGTAPSVEVTPSHFQAQWLEPTSESDPPHVLISGADDTQIADFPVQAPVHTLHPRQWWNALLGNPAGYLPQDSGITRVDVDLPRQHFLSFGPDWVRVWEFPFFTSVILASLVLKFAVRIQ